MRLQHRRRVVQEQARSSQLGEALRRFDERLMAAAAVEEPRLELGAGRDNRLSGLLQILDVIERVVQAKDVDAALSCARNEPPGEVTSDRPRADEEAAA